MTICMFDVICVTNRKLCEEDFLSRIEKICKSSVSAVILREKDLSADDYRKLSEKVINICHKYNKKCILHSHADIVSELNADGLHVTMDTFRKIPENKIFTGVSCHSIEEAKEAQTLGADYIIAGHIFETDCKKGLAPRGLNFLSEICHNVDIPIYAIGGINNNNIQYISDAGADGCCIMSGFMRGDIFEYKKNS